MEEYLKKVLEQVRCKKAQGEIREELRAHIEPERAVFSLSKNLGAVKPPCLGGCEPKVGCAPSVIQLRQAFR